MLLAALLFSLSAQAESWCASPLYVHEWGVEVFRADGHREPPVELPSWFYGGPGAGSPEGEPVRNLPADSGIRTLPVVHFYTPRVWGGPTPVAVEVGFREGQASAWYPQADLVRPADQANGALAYAARLALEVQRSNRVPFGEPMAPLPGDPTAQLAWDALTLTPEPTNEPLETDVGWVHTLRDLDALWVERGGESERFLFYEADTRERPALRVERGETWTPERPHYLLHNDSEHAVHDVLVVHDGGEASFFAPSIPAGSSAGFLLDGAQVEDPRGLLERRLVDADLDEAPSQVRWDLDDCVMMRDPSVPARKADGHRLFEPEVDAILDVWAERFFEQDRTTILYREDAASLDRLVPLSVYTDMYHYVQLRRLSLILWQGLNLEAMTTEER